MTGEVGAGRRSGPRPNASTIARKRAWANLTRTIERCRRCPLAGTRKHVVVFRGSLDAKVLFVGEAPGAEEDRVGLPFVGSSGRQLDRAIASLGLSNGDTAILNLIKCRPTGNRFDRAAWEACSPFLDQQLALLRPRWVVTLGSNALRAFVPSARAILPIAGTPIRSGRRQIYPMLHPAAMLHNPRLRIRWEADLHRFRRLLNPATGEAL